MSSFTDNQRDLCSRTLTNLQFIEKAKTEKKEVFEVTQLFNSLLGIIVNIYQNNEIWRGFLGLRLKEDCKYWEIPDTTDDTLVLFLEHLRHAIAHMNVEFDSKNTENIKRIVFCNYRDDSSNRGDPTWGPYNFPVNSIRTFIEKLCKYVANN
jgi:uncharacterized damage-inducible protein DinB